MATLAHQLITCTGSTITPVAAAEAGDATLALPGTFVEVANGSGDTITVTVAGTGDDIEVEIDDGDTAWIGPLATDSVAQSAGIVSWTYTDHTSVTVAAVRINPNGHRTSPTAPTFTHRAVLASGDDVRAEGPSGLGSAPLLVWCHEGGGDVDSPWDNAIFAANILPGLLDAGWIVACTDQAGPFSWGNDDAVAAVGEVIEWVETVWTVTDVVLLGVSMGGVAALNYVHQGSYHAELRGVVCSAAACDLQEIYDNDTASQAANIEAAYSFSGSGGYAAATSGSDPLEAAASAYDGLSYRFYASPDDGAVSKTDHSDAAHTLINSGSPTVSSVVTTSGGHLSGDGSAYGFSTTYSAGFISFVTGLEA